MLLMSPFAVSVAAVAYILCYTLESPGVLAAAGTVPLDTGLQVCFVTPLCTFFKLLPLSLLLPDCCTASRRFARKLLLPSTLLLSSISGAFISAAAMLDELLLLGSAWLYWLLVGDASCCSCATGCCCCCKCAGGRGPSADWKRQPSVAKRPTISTASAAHTPSSPVPDGSTITSREAATADAPIIAFIRYLRKDSTGARASTGAE